LTTEDSEMKLEMAGFGRSETVARKLTEWLLRIA